MAHQTEKLNDVRLTPDDSLDAEYRELMKLAGEDGCKCGIEGCPGHEDLGGYVLFNRDESS